MSDEQDTGAEPEAFDPEANWQAIMAADDPFQAVLDLLGPHLADRHWLDQQDIARAMFGAWLDAEIEKNSPADGVISGLLCLAAAAPLRALDRALGLPAVEIGDFPLAEWALGEAGFYGLIDEDPPATTALGWDGLRETFAEVEKERAAIAARREEGENR